MYRWWVAALRSVLLPVLLVLLLVSLPGAATAQEATERRPDAKIPAVVDDYLDDVVEETGTPGIAAAVLRDGEILATAAAGEDGRGRPMTTHTRMRVESLSKSFTALAVMQLVESGKLSLDDRAGELLPQFDPADERAGRITVRHLLHHTSGMTDATAPDLYAEDVRTLEEAVARLEESTLASQPGTVAAYHNPNYHVAARIVEVVSGQRFADYLADHVFTPLRMRDTTDLPTAAVDVPGSAHGHLLAYGQAVPVEGPDYFVDGSGGVISTAADMARWVSLHQRGGRTPDGTRLVNATSIRRMHTPGPDTNDYGFGWYHAESAEGPPVRTSHSGAGAGFGAYQGIFDGSGYGAVVLINSGAGLTSPAPGVLAQNLLHEVDNSLPTLSSNADHGRTDLILTGLAVLTVGLSVIALTRARRWARRRYDGHRVITAVRLLPWLIPAGLVLALPALQLWATGRGAPYQLLFLISPVAMTWLALWALAGLAVIGARTFWFVRLRGEGGGI